MEKLWQNKKLVLIFTVGLTLIVLVLIGNQLMSHWNPSKNSTLSDGYTEITDQTSGNIISYTSTEPEEEGNTLSLVGFSVFYDFGFSAAQQAKITSAVSDFFTANYPDFTIISYKKDSFGYVENTNNYNDSYFTVTSNSGQSFLVSLDTGGSLDEIIVKVSPF